MTKFTIKQEVIIETQFNPGDHISATIVDKWGGEWFNGYIKSVNEAEQSFRLELYDTKSNPRKSHGYTWYMDGTTDKDKKSKFQIKLRCSVI